MQRQLGRLDRASPEELTTKFTEAQRLRERQQAAVSRLEGLLGDSTLEQLKEERREASRQRRDAEEILAHADLQRASAINPVEYNKLRFGNCSVSG